MAEMTPAARLALLEPRLDAQARACKTPDDYYQGRHRLSFATEKFRQQFGSLFGTLAVNWCRLPVDAVVERLAIDAFLFGDPEADKLAAEFWQANNMLLKSRMLHAEAIKLGRAYTLVEPPSVPGGPPNIYVEHPSQMIVQHAPGRREVRVAALKKWKDDDGYLYAVLYLPDWMFSYRSQQKATQTVGGRTNWGSPYDVVVNPLGVVPVVPFYNAQQLMRDGCSDLDPAIPIQDILNKLIADMLVDSEATAFVQRYVTGWDEPTDDQGKRLPETELEALRSKFLTFKDPDVTVGELQGQSLERFVGPIGMVIQHFSAVTRMPPHYLTGTIVNASGDALEAAEAGLSFKGDGKVADFSDPAVDTMKTAFLAAGYPQYAAKRGAQVTWLDREKKSLAERADAAVKMRSVGVPFEETWRILGFNDEQIGRMKRLAGLPERQPPGAPITDPPPGAPALPQIVLPAGVTA